jgi:heme-binding protein
MKTTAAMRHRRLFAGLLAAAAPGVACAVLAGPAATGANDPCAASEVARTIGSVSKSIGDYLDAHPETNQTMTAMLQQQGGPESMKSYFAANPKVAADMGSITQPLTSVSTQCKLPISIPQAMGLMQQAQGAGGLPGLPGGAAGTPPVGPQVGNGAPGTGPGTAPKAAGSVPGPARGNSAG